MAVYRSPLLKGTRPDPPAKPKPADTLAAVLLRLEAVEAALAKLKEKEVGNDPLPS